MNTNRIMILVTGVILIVSGFFIYSTLRAKQLERTSFLAKIQDLQSNISALTKTGEALKQTITEKTEQQVKAQGDIAAFETQVGDFRKNEATMKSKIDSLSKEKESLTKYMENNNLIVAKLQKKIELLQQERKQLEETKRTEAAAATSSPAFVDPMNEEPDADTETKAKPGARVAQEEIVDLGRIVIRKSTNQPASVEYINSLYGFVVLGAGSGDGLRNNSIVNITRNNRFIAKAVVKKVRNEVASAVTLPEWTREEIKVGDLVSVNNATP